jgi:hypothetical protein
VGGSQNRLIIMVNSRGRNNLYKGVIVGISHNGENIEHRALIIIIIIYLTDLLSLNAF